MIIHVEDSRRKSKTAEDSRRQLKTVEDSQRQSKILIVAKPFENDFKIKVAFWQYIVFKRVSFLSRKLKTEAFENVDERCITYCRFDHRFRVFRWWGKFRMLLKAGMWNVECRVWNGKWRMGNIEWGTGNAEWRVEKRVGNGEKEEVNGEWRKRNMEWGMESGE